MAVKFKMCKRCQETKADPLEKNWVTPDQEYCSACELEMYKLFVKGLGYSASDVHSHLNAEPCETYEDVNRRM